MCLDLVFNTVSVLSGKCWDWEKVGAISQGVIKPHQRLKANSRHRQKESTCFFVLFFILFFRWVAVS